MDISEIVIGVGQIGSSVILGGMALMYSHRVYNIEKNRDLQHDKDKLIGLILELVKDNQEYFMKRSDLKNKVVGANGESIYSNAIWGLLKSEKFDFSSQHFKIQLEDEFNKINTQKYENIRLSRENTVDDFIESHKLYVTNIMLFCERIFLLDYSDDINSSIRNLLESMSIEHNKFIDHNSVEQIFYYFGITNDVIKSTDQLIHKLNTLLQEKS